MITSGNIAGMAVANANEINNNLDQQAQQPQQTIKVQGIYIQCTHMRAVISQECCDKNRKDRKRREMCRDCTTQPKPVDINQALEAEPSHPGDGRTWLPKVSWMRSGFSFANDERHQANKVAAARHQER